MIYDNYGQVAKWIKAPFFKEIKEGISCYFPMNRKAMGTLKSKKFENRCKREGVTIDHTPKGLPFFY